MSASNNMTMKVEREFTIKRKKHPSAPRYNGRANQELGSSLTKLMSLLEPTEVEQLFNRELIMDEEGTALEFDAVLPTDIVGIALDFEGEGFVSTMMEVVSIENDTMTGKDAYTEEELSFTFEEASVARALGYFEVLYRKDADGKDIPFGVDNEMKVKVLVPDSGEAGAPLVPALGAGPDTEPVVDPGLGLPQDPNAAIPAGLPANIGDIAAASTDPEVLKGLIEAAKAAGTPVIPPVGEPGVSEERAASGLPAFTPGPTPGSIVVNLSADEIAKRIASLNMPAPGHDPDDPYCYCDSCADALEAQDQLEAQGQAVAPIAVSKPKRKSTKPVMAKSGGKRRAIKKVVGVPAGSLPVVVIKTEVDVGNAGKPAKKARKPKAVQAPVVPVEADSFTLDEFIDKIAGEITPETTIVMAPVSAVMPKPTKNVEKLLVYKFSGQGDTYLFALTPKQALALKDDSLDYFSEQVGGGKYKEFDSINALNKAGIPYTLTCDEGIY